MHIEARLLRATRVDLPQTTGTVAVLLCTVHSVCTLDLPDPCLHRSLASTRGRLMHWTRLIFRLLSPMCLNANPAFIRDFTVPEYRYECNPPETSFTRS